MSTWMGWNLYRKMRIMAVNRYMSLTTFHLTWSKQLRLNRIDLNVDQPALNFRPNIVSINAHRKIDFMLIQHLTQISFSPHLEKHSHFFNISRRSQTSSSANAKQCFTPWCVDDKSVESCRGHHKQIHFLTHSLCSAALVVHGEWSINKLPTHYTCSKLLCTVNPKYIHKK